MRKPANSCQLLRSTSDCSGSLDGQNCSRAGKPKSTSTREITQPIAEYKPNSRTGESGLVHSDSRPIAVVKLASVHGCLAIFIASTTAVRRFRVAVCFQ